jgi:hypothetical protein
MEEKIITIPFNSEEFIKNQKVAWSFSLKKVLNSYIVYTIIPITILLMGFLLDEVYINFVGSLFLFYIILRWIELLKTQKKYFKKLGDVAKRYERETIDCTFTFSENGIQYVDKEKLYKMNWSLFNRCVVFKNTILLFARDTERVWFTFSENTIGEENYNEVYHILKDKISQNK